MPDCSIVALDVRILLGLARLDGQGAAAAGMAPRFEENAAGGRGSVASGGEAGAGG